MGMVRDVVKCGKKILDVEGGIVIGVIGMERCKQEHK